MKAMDISAAGAPEKAKRAPHKFQKAPRKDTSRNMRKVKAGETPYGGFDSE